MSKTVTPKKKLSVKKSNLTEIIFILDESGSMEHLTNDTIGGYNSFIKEQKNTNGEARLTTVAFNNKYRFIHQGVDLKEVELLSKSDYRPSGMTALLDALGRTIDDLSYRIEHASKKERPSNVIFVVTTDGEENSSLEYNTQQIKDKVQSKTEKDKWQFIFLGANIDAVTTGAQYGFSAQSSVNYTASDKGTESLYRSVSRGISQMREESLDAEEAVLFDVAHLEGIK